MSHQEVRIVLKLGDTMILVSTADILQTGTMLTKLRAVISFGEEMHRVYSLGIRTILSNSSSSKRVYKVYSLRI